MRNRFSCVVTCNNQELHNNHYQTLREIADALNLSYQQVADISTGRPNKFRNNKFKFAPTIAIQKILEHNKDAQETEGQTA
tara:strand:+ start:320 stop:562 length:243 start_codon:yes stop_codon:yes gene_type:complete